MSRNTTQTVTKGRIVFFQTKTMLEDAIEAQAAIVTKVHDNDTVDLTVFPSGAVPEYETSVGYFDGFDLKTPDMHMAWWWPPRA